MLSLIKLLFLFNGLIFIYGFCPNTYTVQTTSINSANAVVINNAAGLTDFPTATATKKQLEFFGTFKVQEACTGATATAQKNLLSITVTTTDTGTTTSEKELLRLYVDCSNLKLETTGVWATPLGTTTRSAVTAASDIQNEIISIFLAVNLEKNYYSLEYLSRSYHDAHLITMTTTQTYVFDTTTKIYFCAAKAGASPNSCLASDVKVGFATLPTTLTNPMVGYVGGSTPTLGSFYPLSGSLANAYTANAVGDAYFGNAATSPTAATAAAWDTSNTFVKISTLGQFLSIPLPTLKSADGTATGATYKTLAIAAYVRIASLPANSQTSTILAMHQSSNAAELGYKLVVDQTSRDVNLLSGTTAVTVPSSTTLPKITLNTWTLVGFSVVLSSDGKNAFGTFFVDSTSITFDIRASATAMSLTNADLLRVGSVTGTNSFVGDISIVRVTSPGAGFTKTGTEQCLSTSQIELGSGSFGLKCTDTSMLSVVDSKCYSTCPDGTLASTGTVKPLCFSCPAECATCDSNGCLSCPTGDVLYNKKCFDKCPVATYQSAQKCFDCKAGCVACSASECFVCSVTQGYIADPNKGVCYLMDPKAGTGPGVAGLVCAALILIAYLIYAYNSEENLSIYGSKQNVGFKSVANYQN